MSALDNATRSESPDPSSHASNIYDTGGAEGEWVDEEDDDDMDFEPTTDDSEDVEFFDLQEDDDGDFHGMRPTSISLGMRDFYGQ